LIEENHPKDVIIDRVKSCKQLADNQRRHIQQTIKREDKP
jgi:hypothetical protein